MDGELGQADPNMCDWIGGRQLPGAEGLALPVPGDLPAGKNLREIMAAPARESLRPILGDGVERISDAELLEYSLPV